MDADWGRILTYVFASADPGDQLTPHGLPFDRAQLGDVLRANRMPQAF